MLGTILSAAFSWLGGKGGLTTITEQLADAYQAKLNAETNQERLEAMQAIAQLEARQNVLLAESKQWYTSWIRPTLAFPVVVFVWKILIWDTVLQWGVTPYPGDMVMYLVYTVVGAYFLTRQFGSK